MGLNDVEMEELEEFADSIGGVQSVDSRRKLVIKQARIMGNPGPTDDQLEQVLRNKGLWNDTLPQQQNLSPD